MLLQVCTHAGCYVPQCARQQWETENQSACQVLVQLLLPGLQQLSPLPEGSKQHIVTVTPTLPLHSSHSNLMNPHLQNNRRHLFLLQGL